MNCKMNENIKRKNDIVFLNVMFCIMVVFIHISSELVINMEHTKPMFWAVYVLSRLCGFSVSGFIMLSGIKLMLKSDNINYGKFYLSRLVSVVLPYIICVCIYYAYFCYAGDITYSIRDLIGHIIRGDLWAHFYFVIVIVQFYILAPLWVILFKRANPAVSIAISLLIGLLGSNINEILNIFGIYPGISGDKSFVGYIFFWTAGCIIGRHYNEFTQYLKAKWLSVIFMFFVFTSITAILLIKTAGADYYWMEIVYTLYSISALLFCFMSARIFAGYDGIWFKPIKIMDSITYHIYLMHCLILVIVNNFLTTKGINDLIVRYRMRAVLVYGGSIILCVIWNALKSLLKKSAKKI